MYLHYDRITEEGLAVDEQFDFSSDSELNGTCRFRGVIYPAQRGFLFNGEITCTVPGTCDRCLEPFTETVQTETQVLIVPARMLECDDEELELSDDDSSMYPAEDDGVNLKELARQEAILSIPAKRLCSDECKGLCHECGANLNAGKCRCSGPVDPRWEKLKQAYNTIEGDNNGCSEG